MNLAMVEGDQVTIAVVGDASTGEIHVAERGRGAWASAPVDRQLAASDESLTIVIEQGNSTGTRREHAARFTSEAIGEDRWDVRNLSTTLSLSYVAAGRVAAYVVFAVPALHTAAGSLLVTEAGGILTDIDGQPWTLRSDSILASAGPALHRDLIDLARATQDESG